MKKILGLMAGLLLLGAAVSPAKADLYSFSFLSIDTFSTATGTFTTGAPNGPGFDITSISGSVTGPGGGSILGLIGGSAVYPGNIPSPSGAFIVDNILFPSSDPTLTTNGVLFTTGVGNEWNMWGNSPNNYTLYKWESGIGYTLTKDGNMSIAAIPEPEIYAMLAAGLGLMGFVARRRKQQLAAG
jgi:hypothetical protein